MKALTSAINKLAGPEGLTGVFRSMGGDAVDRSAVGICVSCLRSTFVVRHTLHCSVGKGHCVSAPSGFCFRSLNLEGTLLGFHRIRGARLVRGTVCGRLHTHKVTMSMNRIV